MSGKHRDAMKQELEWLQTIVEPVGIVVSGSIIRGNPGPSSDLDIEVLHDQPWRRRIQRWFCETPVELFLNPPQWMHHYIRDEAAHGRPSTANMLTTGKLIFDTNQRMAAIIDIAREVLSRGPSLSPHALLRDRYTAACLVEDALDFGGADTPDSRQILALAVDAVVSHAYLRKNRFLPRRKERLALLPSIEPEVARLLSLALIQAPTDGLVHLQEASERVLGTSGFFEWDSGQDNSSPASRT